MLHVRRQNVPALPVSYGCGAVAERKVQRIRRRKPETKMNTENIQQPTSVNEAESKAGFAAPSGSATGLHMKYFVLKPRGEDIYAVASRRAMNLYAATVEKENPALAEELRKWVTDEWVKTEGAQKLGQILVDVDNRERR